jgi:hypothetical protein
LAAAFYQSAMIGPVMIVVGVILSVAVFQAERRISLGMLFGKSLDALERSAVR